MIVVTTIFGCWGLNRGSHKLVLFYACLLALIFVIELSAGILAYIYRGQVSGELAQNLEQKFKVEYGVNNETTVAVDHLQMS